MIKFGPSGNSEAFRIAGNKHSTQSAKWVKDMGLDCFEYSFGRGINLSDEKATELNKVFKENNIEISVHAPYYINLANTEEENAEKSYNYIMNSGVKARLLGGKRVVFHPASQGKMTRNEAVELCKKRFYILAEKIHLNNLDDIMFCPETMGKLGQIGTIEEITDFCLIDKVFTPCVDFGHVNAREHGSLKTEEDFIKRMSYMIDKLGYDRMKHFHVHFSKIEYSEKGEVRHLTFEDTKYGPDPENFIKAIKKLKLEPYVVCESAGTQDIDSLKLKKSYFVY